MRTQLFAVALRATVPSLFTLKELYAMTELKNCPDCGVAIGHVHENECDIERCSTCGQQRITCGCTDHDPTKTAWTGYLPDAESNTGGDQVLRQFCVKAKGEVTLHVWLNATSILEAERKANAFFDSGDLTDDYPDSHEATSDGYWRDGEYVAEEYDVVWEFVSRNCTECVDTTDVGEPL